MKVTTDNQAIYNLDRVELHAKLDTLLTLWGMENLATIINDWTMKQDMEGVWKLECIMSEKEAHDMCVRCGKELKPDEGKSKTYGDQMDESQDYCENCYDTMFEK